MPRVRSLSLRKEALTDLTTDELVTVVGADAMTHYEGMTGCGSMCLTEGGKTCGITLPLYECLPDGTAR